MRRGRATRRAVVGYRTVADQIKLWQAMDGDGVHPDPEAHAQHRADLVRMARAILEASAGQIPPPTMMQNGEPWRGY